MFKALKKMFPGDDWQDTRQSVTRDDNWWKKLREGAKVEFGSIPQSSISNAELSIKNTQYYDFGNSSFTSYMLHDGNKLQCQVIVAQQGDNNTYLAISRHLSEDELYRICSQEDVKLLTQPRHLKRLYVREQAMGLDGWLSMRYSKKLDNIRGSKTVNDQERSFDYTLLVSDDNSKAIEVERYHDGRCEIYITVYRPVTDIIDITGGSAFSGKRGIADMSNVQHTVSIPTLDEKDTMPVRGPALTRDESAESALRAPVNDDTIIQANISAASKNIVEKTTAAPLPKAEPVAAAAPVKRLEIQPLQVNNPVISGNKTTEFMRSTADKLPPVSETLKAVAKEVNKEFIPTDKASSVKAFVPEPITAKEVAPRPVPKPMPIPEIRKQPISEQTKPKVEAKQPPAFEAYKPVPLKTPAAKLEKMIDPIPAAPVLSKPATKPLEKDEIKAITPPAAKAVKKPSLAIEDIKREIEAKIQEEIKREMDKKNGGSNVPFPHNIAPKKKEVAAKPQIDEPIKDNPAAPSPDQVVVKRVKQEKIDCNMRVAGKIIDEAVRRDMHLADVMRNVLGLPINASDEVTLHIPLTNEDYKTLGERYKVSPDNRNKIKRRIVADLAGFAGENKRLAEDA